MDRKSILIGAMALWAFAGTGGSARSADFVDVHMHLHPVGLTVALGQGGGSGGQRSTMGQRRPGGFGGRQQRFGRPGGRRPMMGGQGSGTKGASRSENLAKAAKHLISRMDGRGVAKGLVVVVPSHRSTPEEDYKSMRDAVRRHPGRLFLIGGGARLGALIQKIEPRHVTAAVRRDFQRIAEEILADGAVAFGEMISYHLCMTEKHSFQEAAADHPLFLLLADMAARHDVPIDLHMEAVERSVFMPKNLLSACSKNPRTLTPTVPALERLLRHNRKARIVWQHIGWDNASQMTPDLIGRLLSRHANLYLALRLEDRTNQVGNGGPMPNRIAHAGGRVTAEWRAIMDAFPDRLMIGSDEFFGPQKEENKRSASFDGTWSILNHLPPDMARRIGRENAARVYGLK